MAKARRADYKFNTSGEAWHYPDGSKPRNGYTQTLADIQRKLASYKEGERAWVMCAWKNGGAHIFNVAIENGEVVWYDGQIQKIYSRERQGNNGVGMERFNQCVLSGNNWGIIEHTETLIPDDSVLKSVEPWKPTP